MKHKETDPFYKSDRWQTIRKMVLKRDAYQCQFAKARGKMIPADVVHHIFPREEFPEFQWKTWNLISLSSAAHNMMHRRDGHALSDIGEELRQKVAIAQGIEQEQETILVIGRPGVGKTTYVKERLKGGIVYDLDYIAAALRLKKPKEERYWPARRVADKMLRGFVKAAHEFSRVVFVIRTAPTEDEIFEVNPTKVVILQGAYQNPEIDPERMRDIAQRLKAAREYCERNDIRFEEIER